MKKVLKETKHTEDYMHFIDNNCQNPSVYSSDTTEQVLLRLLRVIAKIQVEILHELREKK